MLIASILPVFFACVHGANVSVLNLAPSLNITLPFIGIPKRQLDLHGTVVIEERSTSTSDESGPRDIVLQLAPNTAFTFPLLSLLTPKSVLHENAPLRQGSISKPCKIGQSCYQLLTAREYALIYLSPTAGKGIIVSFPEDKLKSPSAIIVQKKGDTSADPSIPEGVGVAERIELDMTDTGQGTH
nr:unnamed protein product [Spirometra erinaceieuropaei]